MNSFLLGVWIPRQLDPNGMDENAKLEYGKCMIGAGIMNEAVVRNWT